MKIIIFGLITLTAQSQSLINGSFENYTGGVNASNQFSNTMFDATVTGWSPSGTSNVSLFKSGLPASDGSNFLYVDATEHSQNITLAAGTYNISFDLASFSSNSIPLDLNLNSSNVGTFDVVGTSGWQAQSHTFTHSGGNLNIGFAGGSSFGLGLDNVALTQIPEPSSIALLGLGTFGLITRRKR